MAGFSINLKVGTDAPKGGKAAGDPSVLELRVHGVNNTTPAALLDLPDDGVQLVMGDKLGSFWEPTADAAAAAKRGRRGHVPPGVTREAYSWGGMVRTTPNFGGVGAAGAVAAVVARVLYALILPFSIGNAVAWSRRLTTEGESRVWAGITAGLARLFGLTLTLVFTTAAATLSIDMIGAQCAEQAGLCTPIQALLDPLAPWTSAQRLALFSLGPVLAVAGLWVFSAFSRLRYDVLPGMADSKDTLIGSGTDPQTGRRRPTAALSQPGFWSNRITRLLARGHLACAILLTTALVAQDAAADAFPAAAGDSDTGRYTVIAAIAWSLLVVAVVIVCALPTMTIPPIEGRGVRWPSRVTGALLGLAIGMFAAILAILVWFTDASAFQDAPAGGRGLYGAGFIPLVLIGFAGLLTLSGIFWRPWRGRRATAWAGCAPAVFMVVALSLAVATSSIVVVTIGNWLNANLAASDLIRDHDAASSALQIPSVWVGLGATILVAGIVAVVVVLTAVVVRRTVTARAEDWAAPAKDGDQVIPVGAGIMPVSQSVLLARIEAKRRSAALLHLVEPATAILGILLAMGILLGWVWTGAAYLADVSLWAALPGMSDEAVKNFLNVAMWGLGASGLFLVGLLASGATSATPRPLGIVWDIACYLPRTGQPFGPPCFAQRAVPEIAGRMYSWLLEDDRRKVVLVAHSMGAVLAVSSLGLLASTPDSRRMLDRISLLTFGVQLRAYFGRMLPELLGPVPLDTRPSRGPGFFRRDPWRADRTSQLSAPGTGAAGDRLGGTLLAGWSVRWVSLWRLTDFLGFPAMSTVPASADGSFRNGVDRFARELDTSGYMVDVGTHGEYFREPEYDKALLELAGLPPGVRVWARAPR